MIGRTIQHYRILDPLGAGGMGQVYVAEDTRLGRRVALKVLPPELVESHPELLQRFEREARAVAALNHPNIVTVHSVEEEDGVHFLTMELVEGETLDQLIPDGGMPLERFLSIALQLADALDAAHRRGIVHRDLKPSNVMVGEDDRVKILDFGLAKLHDTAPAGDDAATLTAGLTQQGAVMGTVPYMSPEQVKGQEVDHRTDLFSLGIVLYEMATGARPFQGETSAELISSILRDVPADVRELKGELPPHLEEVIRGCLEKDLEKRTGSAGELRKNLEELQRTDAPKEVAPASRSGLRSRMPLVALAAAIVAVFVTFYSTRPSPEAPETSITSLAVMPLRNLSGDGDQEYFADGITEALINELGRIRALRVISRTSAMRYKGSDKSLTEIARELGVDAVIEGSVLRDGERVAVSAGLVDGATDQQLWSNIYERDLNDVFALRKEVAKAIAHEVRVTLTPEEAEHLDEVRTVDPAAYDAALKGRYLWNNRFTPAGLREAIGHFERAVEIDPTYAAAYAGLADGYVGLEVTRALSSHQAMPRARSAALEALKLDESLAEAHTSFSLVLWNYDWQWEAAQYEAHLALELNPSYALAHQWLGVTQAMLGRGEEALAAIRRAQELDPLSLLIRRDVGFIHYLLRDYEAAAAELEKTLDLDPGYVWARELLARVHVARGRLDEAFAQYEKIEADAELSATGRAELAYARALAGEADEARRLLAELEDEAAGGQTLWGNIALVYVGLGETDRALDRLERAMEEHDSYVVLLRQTAAWDPLRELPRFQAIVRPLDFPEL